MKKLCLSALAAMLAASLVIAGCAPAAPAQPTAAPAKPAVAPTTAPAAPAAAPKTGEPTKAPAAQPTAAPAAKVNWPEKGKTLSIYVGYAAGGPFDLLTRILQPGLEKVLGVQIQVVNKAGASQMLALTEVARAKPDGYTIGGIGQSTVSIAMQDPENKPSISRKDFVPIANMEQHASILVANPTGPYKTMKDVVDAAKAKPKSVKFSAIGQLGTGALVGYFLEEVTGAKFAYIFYDSGAESQAAVMGGIADVTSVNPIVAVPAVKGGQLIALASTGKEPSAVLPDAKPLHALGYNVINYTSWGFAAPAATPKEIVAILDDAIKQALAMDDIKKKIMETGNDVAYMNSADFSKYWDQHDIDAKKGIDAARAQR